MNTIKIWAPRYHDMTVLVACHKVRDGINKIVFTKSYPGKELLMDGAEIKTYPHESNGTIKCYAIPFLDFTIHEVEDDKQIIMELK